MFIESKDSIINTDYLLSVVKKEIAHNNIFTIELFFSDQSSIKQTFETAKERNEVFDHILLKLKELK